VYDYLVWSDEFDTNGAIDNAKWFHQTQLPTPGSWYNGEVQHYTNRTANAVIEDGILKIIAKKESFTDQGYTKQYTSAEVEFEVYVYLRQGRSQGKTSFWCGHMAGDLDAGKEYQ
jgi:hypothetical protein